MIPPEITCSDLVCRDKMVKRINALAIDKVSKSTLKWAVGIIIMALLGSFGTGYHIYAEGKQTRISEIKKNREQIEQLNMNTVKIQTDLGHIKEQLKAEKQIQDAILKELRELNHRGSDKVPR